MIVRNEEEVLARCLTCIKDAVDEIVIVDTGSLDLTQVIAKQFTSHVYHFSWIDDFAAARNFAFSKATKDYIMWLDADDVLTSQSAHALRQFMNTLNPSVEMVMMPYHVAFDSQGTPTMSYERERIVKRSVGYRWEGAIHEVITPRGIIVHEDIPVLHKKIGPGDPDRNLRIFEKMAAEGSVLSPRDQFYFAREVMFHKQYDRAIGMLEDFIQSDRGWIENVLSACRDLASCYQALNQMDKAKEALIRTFIYDIPRAETLCQLGQLLFDQGRYDKAIFWYELAASGKLPRPAGAFILPDCYGYIPYMQLCVCYDRLGDHEKAMQMNDLAGEIKPNDPNYMANKAYFLQIHANAKQNEEKSKIE